MNIGIIEQNTIFRESLKTILDQIQDFTVVFDLDNIGDLQYINKVGFDLMLLDYSLGKSTCNEIINKTLAVNPAVKFLLLANNKEECNYNCFKTIDIILKTSAKKEFEQKIRKLLNIQH